MRRGELIRAVYEFIELFAVAAAAVVLAAAVGLRLSTVSGSSMDYTLHEGERILMFHQDELKRGDIVVFSRVGSSGCELIVKRVIAFGGETVYLDNESWRVYIDGEELDEPYITRVTADMSRAGTEELCVVPEGCVYVMGDNRYYSTDSRDAEVGPVELSRIVGKVIFRFMPLSRFGPIS